MSPHKLSPLNILLMILFYFDFYQILTAFNKFKKYDRGCTIAKYWLPSASWKIWQSLYYFYQILTAFNKLKKNMSELVLLLTYADRLQQVENYARCYAWKLKWAKLFTSIVNQYLIDQSSVLDVSTEPLKTLSAFCLTYCNSIINRRSQYWAIHW
jgi:hypothetical protein